MKAYSAGIPEILQMIEQQSFDPEKVSKLLRDEDIDNPVLDLHGYSTTYLYEAMSANNLPAVKYFLEHGADPNLYNPDLISDCALWDLQYIDSDQNWSTRYEIAKLFFLHGADPNITTDDGESLYEYVLFKVYNDTPIDDNDWENLKHLYKLLAIYKSALSKGTDKWPRLDAVDMNQLDNYDVDLELCDDGYHIKGYVVDENGDIVGEL